MERSKPVLYIFAGLPGSGKTTLAQALAIRTGATYLRIDTVEQSLRELCNLKVEGEGYEISYRIAADNLRLNRSVIADSCNPIRLTRMIWQEVAEQESASFLNIEVICSDVEEHQHRVEEREVSIEGLVLPTWEQVLTREYHPWEVAPTIIDTAGMTVERSIEELLSRLGIG